MELVNYLILLGIAQGIFFGVILFSLKRGNRKANRVIGLLMILFAVSISDTVLYKIDFYQSHPHFLLIGYPLVFLFGPLLLLYVKILIGKKIHFNFKYFYHFFPFIILVLYLMPFYLQGAEEKLHGVLMQQFSASEINFYVHILQIVHVFIYVFIVNKVLKEHDRNVKNTYSSVERITLNWLRQIMVGLVAVFFMSGLIIFITDFGNVNQFGTSIIGLMVAYYLCKMGYMSIKQPEIFMVDLISSHSKYEKSTLSENKKNEYLENLIQIMDLKKPYVKSDLTIQGLAETSKIPAYHLSQILNEKLQKNFFDFINGYRIEEAKNKLQDPQNNKFSILAIAYDVGFNSKSAFNNAFKKHAGKTPSQFRNTL